MKKPLTTLAILTLAACSTPPPATPAQPAVPATPALPAPPACVTEPPDTSDAEAVADTAAYYLTCIDASDTSPRDQISRAAPYLTQSIFDTLSTSTAKPDRYWNLTISAKASTTVTVERLYMDNYDPTATTTSTLDRLATATSTAAGTSTTYYTFTFQQQTDHTYRISDIATTTQ
ncbi:hypothetical protein [Trueperella abortisuis]|uniref:hypothetical protein n=1 Tax=Trueperella abortisuis TaxID=445930 RepID=UPI002892F539|nr:hypothetical protein [Trueperella abortisuis]